VKGYNEMSKYLDAIEKHDRDKWNHQKDGDTAKAQLAAVAAGLLGAILWGFVTYFTHFILGYFAIGLGVLVGISVKHFGKGSGMIFGIIGGLYALASCFLGMLFSLIFFAAASNNISFVDILFMVDYGEVVKIYFEEFDMHDIAFYGIAFGSAFKISMNPHGKDELDYLLEAKGINLNEGAIDKNHFKKFRQKKAQK
jgi:hypothetical protein